MAINQKIAGMTQQATNKAVVTQFRNELANKHNPDAWNTFCSANFTHHLNLPDVPPTLDGIKTLSASILAAFPDLRATVDLLIADGDFVVERVTMRATHSGAYRSMIPTGTPYEWPETHIYQLTSGKIVALFPEVRLEKLLWQIGEKGSGFVAPAKSVLSTVVAFMMGGLSKLYTTKPNLPTEEVNKSIVSRYVNEFKNQQKFGVFPRLFSADFTHHFNFPGRNNRMSSFVSVGQNFLAAFPDVRVDLQRLLAEDDWVVEQNKVKATHKGTFNGAKATNKTVAWTEIHIYRLEDGKIIENYPAVNFERILLQIS